MKVSEVERRDVPLELEWTATLDGYISADVRPSVEGYVTRRLYREGTYVAENAPLFQIDERPYRQAYDRARAELARAQAEQLRARANYARVAPLADSGAVSHEEVTNARAASEASNAGVAAGRAALRDARLNLEWTTVRAPVSGIAGLRQVEIGDLVRPTDVLTRVASLDPMRATFSITETQYLESAEILREVTYAAASPSGADAGNPGASTRAEPGVTRGELALVLADGSVHPHPGRFEAVGLGVDPATGTLPIRCLFPNPDLLLRPGQFARIRLRSAAGRNALVVPTRAITELQGLEQVAVVDPDAQTVEVRTVRLGARVGEAAIVQGGLREGELVVVEGVQGLRTGARVRATRLEPTPVPNGGSRGEPEAR